MIQTILRDTEAELRVTLYVAGEATDADESPTVTITADSTGTAIVTDAATTKPSGTTGVYAYKIAPNLIPDVDLLRAVWTASIGGTAGQEFTTVAEVVGGYITTLDAIERAAVGVTLTPDDLVRGREYAERWLEDECKCAFRPRYRREQRDGKGRTKIKLERPRPLALRSVTIGTTTLTAAELAAITLKPSGALYRSAGWASGEGNIVVIYEHGFEHPPEPVVNAATRLAAHYLTPNPMSYDERATRIDTEAASYSLVTPGQRGAVHSLPEVNAVVDDYGYRSAG